MPCKQEIDNNASHSHRAPHWPCCPRPNGWVLKLGGRQACHGAWPHDEVTTVVVVSPVGPAVLVPSGTLRPLAVEVTRWRSALWWCACLKLLGVDRRHSKCDALRVRLDLAIFSGCMKLPSSAQPLQCGKACGVAAGIALAAPGDLVQLLPPLGDAHSPPPLARGCLWLAQSPDSDVPKRPPCRTRTWISNCGVTLESSLTNMTPPQEQAALAPDVIVCALPRRALASLHCHPSPSQYAYSRDAASYNFLQSSPAARLPARS